MNLKNKVDANLRRIFYLTETIKKLQPCLETKNVQTMMVLKEVLNEYQEVVGVTRPILFDFIQEERTKRGVSPIDYIRIYRKLGEKYEHTN